MMLKIPKQIVGKKVILRQLKKSDAVSIYHYAKDRAITKWTTHIPYPYPRGAALIFIRRSAQQIKAGKLVNYGITLKGTDEVIGLIGLNKIKIDKEMQRAEIGYWLGKPFWGSGIMSEAVKLMLDLAFHNLKLHRVYAGVFQSNPASLRVLKKVGFIQEGLMREVRFRYGKWHTVVGMSMLKREYERRT